MWNTETLWLEVAIVSFIFAVGNIVFGHFEEQTPKWRRVGKYLLVTLAVVLLSVYLGRIYAFSLLGLMLIPVLYIHGFYLPKKKGINGLTGEPKSKYYDFRGWDKDVFKER